MKTRLGLAVLAVAVCAPGASAGETFLTIDGGWYDMTNARDSAHAIFGSSGGPVIGFAGEYGLNESFFIRAGARWFRREGERVFVESPEGEVFRLGHPLTVRIVPAYAMVSYRFLAGARLRPYIGLGGGIASYHEESDVAGEIIESSATKAMGMGVVGADYGRGTLRFGLEAGYSLVPNTIGESGVSAVYGEDDVGGFQAVGRISFVF
jgi:hypothetical protein